MIDDIIKKLTDNKSFKLGFSLIFIRWLFTWLITFIAFKLNRVPFVDPYIPVLKEDYYFYELFFIIPYGIFLFLVVCSSAKILLTVFWVKSDFREIILYFAVVAILLWPLYGFVDLFCILTNKWQNYIIIPVHTSAALLEGFLYALGIRKMYKISWIKSFAIGLFCMFIYRPVAVILIR